MSALPSLSYQANASAQEAGRLWPGCQAAMRATIGHLAALGATQEELVAALRRDFPDLPVAEGPAWRADAYYQNVVATELVRLAKQPALRQRPDPPEHAPDPVRLQAAELVLDELRARGAGARRKGDALQVYRLDPATAHRLPDELMAAVEEHQDELWGLAGNAPQSPMHLSAPPQMSPGLVAFAASQGYVCAYCERPGSESADPDGQAWHRDHLPARGGPNPFVLACGACRARPDRAARLHTGDDDELI